MKLTKPLLFLTASNSLFLHDLFGSGYRIGEEYFDVCRDTCRLTMSCWMVSGTVLKGHLCGSAFHVCCSEPRIQQQPYQVCLHGTSILFIFYRTQVFTFGSKIFAKYCILFSNLSASGMCANLLGPHLNVARPRLEK